MMMTREERTWKPERGGRRRSKQPQQQQQQQQQRQATHSNVPRAPPSRKLVVIGDGFVGKTSLLIAYTTHTFPVDYTPTIFENYLITLSVAEQPIELSLWDTAGQEDYDRLRPLSYPDANVILICFSVVDRKSFENVAEKWAKEVRHYCRDVPRMLVGTKSDLRPEARDASEIVFPEDGEGLALQIGAAAYVECSARTGEGVDDVFERAIIEVVQHNPVRLKRPKPTCPLL